MPRRDPGLRARPRAGAGHRPAPSRSGRWSRALLLAIAYLLAASVVTAVQTWVLGPADRAAPVDWASTNLTNLRGRPIESLAASAFVLEPERWSHLAVTGLALTPLTDRFGNRRATLTATTGHVAGTAVGQGLFAARISLHHAPTDLRDMSDVGPSRLVIAALAASPDRPTTADPCPGDHPPGMARTRLAGGHHARERHRNRPPDHLPHRRPPRRRPDTPEPGPPGQLRCGGPASAHAPAQGQRRPSAEFATSLTAQGYTTKLEAVVAVAAAVAVVASAPPGSRMAPMSIGYRTHRIPGPVRPRDGEPAPHRVDPAGITGSRSRPSCR
ncbi:rhomboid-like protein [Embleya sp. NPDC008237]|uniref:rhomboid-like protein n=1 Tax=Embleya sp. NPDC008237 TaxID=3363978 RepID=UPI0036E5FD4A